MKENDYITLNRNLWNQRTEVHVQSDFYDVESFIKGKNSLMPIELALLGDVKGKNILHLQCHFGQDTLSLSRMGANVTGVDFSDKAIDKARELNDVLNLQATFVCCDVLDLPNHLEGEYDIVFTSYGVIGWLPDLNRWGEIISHYLKPKGKFVFVEFHPVVWMFDHNFSQIQYSYFKEKPIIEKEEGTYADKKANIEAEHMSWNHSLEEVLSTLLHHDIQIQQFKEYDYSPYDCFSHTVKIGENQFQIQHLENKIPMTYAVLGEKK